MELSRVLVLMLVLILPVAAFASEGVAEGSGTVITKEDNGKEITAPEGATFEVRLEQAGATGYLWQIVDPDEVHLKVLESNTTPLKGEKIVGGPLLVTWKLKAVKAGRADLKILLYRPWEGIQKAADSFQVRINIR
jgi:predicted secreted protein